MGTFGGHALPGTFFIIFAVWWTVQMFRRYFASRRKGALPFKSSTTFPVDFCCGPTWLRRWEWEGFFKIFFTTIGFIGEVVTARHGGRFAYYGNGQHATMFFFFGLSGLVDILVHHRAPLPKGAEYLIGILAFVVEAMLFMFHLHGRTPFDVLIHTLLLYVVYANVIVTIVEMRYRHSIAVALTRTFLVFLQGTWFWQAGFLLYNPLPGAVPWDDENHDQLMLVTMIFAWHMAAVFILMVVIGAFVAVCQGRCCDGSAGLEEMSRYDGMRLLSQDDRPLRVNGSNNFDPELDSDSAEDVDFEKTPQQKTPVADTVIQ